MWPVSLNTGPWVLDRRQLPGFGQKPVWTSAVAVGALHGPGTSPPPTLRTNARIAAGLLEQGPGRDRPVPFHVAVTGLVDHEAPGQRPVRGWAGIACAAYLATPGADRGEDLEPAERGADRI